MLSKKIIIVGAGGHAKVVIDALFATGITDRDIMVVDIIDQPQNILGIPITRIKNDTELKNYHGSFHIAIGSETKRTEIHKFLQAQKKEILTIIHPHANVSPFAIIGVGSFICAGSVIGPDAWIGECCIINHNAVVDHEVKIGNFSHIAPGAILGGKASIGIGCLIGSSSTILPNIMIGNQVIVGSGAVVTKNISDQEKVLGIPAKSVGKNP